MSDMPPTQPRHAAVPTPPAWTRGHKALASVLVVLGTAISGVAFAEIYVNVTGLLRSSMHGWAWIVPVSGEIAFAFMFGCGILLAVRRAPGNALRGIFMAVLMVASVPLNVWNYRQSLPASIGHLLPVAAFFGCMLVGKGIVMALRGGKVRADRISGGEWLAHPCRSLSLWRWMATWGEPSRERALARYMALLFAVAIAQADPQVGGWPFVWRRKLPVTLRYQLDMGTFPADVMTAIDAGGDWQGAVETWVTDALTRRDKTRAKVRRDRAVIERDNDATATTADGAAGSATAVRQAARPRKRQARDRAPAGWRDKAADAVAANRGINAAGLAEECGVSKRTAERYLSGRATVTPIRRTGEG